MGKQSLGQDPERVASKLAIDAGSAVEMCLQNETLVLTPVRDPMDLGSLLAGVTPRSIHELKDL